MSTRQPFSRRGWLGALLVVAALVSSCGSDDESEATGTVPPPSSEAPASTTSEPSSFPRTVIDDEGTAVRIESIDRIIPLDGDVAEVVFALGHGDRVVATDLSATFPPEADALPEVGYQRALSAETIAGFEPTLLLATDIAGPPEALDDLRRLGYPLVIVPNPSTAEGPGAKIRAVAEALGDPEAGDALARAVDAEIAATTVERPADPPVALALYLRGTAAQMVLGEASASHWLIEAAGGVDGADLLGVVDATPISAEAILAVDPEVLIVTTTGLESVGGIDGLLDIGGLGETRAGATRAVVAVDDQLLLGNGPRVAEVIETLHHEFIHTLEKQ